LKRYSVEALQRTAAKTILTLHRSLRLRVAGVMHFHALGQEPFAPALTAPRKGRPPGFRAHPRAKSVLILSSALGALKCSFHDLAC
jgi:hypothetical protein